MGQYNNIDQAIPGMEAEGIQHNKSVRSRAAQQTIQYGKPVFGYLGEPNKVYNYKLDVGKIVWDADFVTGNTVEVTVNGETTGLVPFNTDHDTTMNDVLAAVTALTVTDSELGDVGVDAALDPDDVNNRTLYIRAVGVDVTVTEDVQSGASQATGTITYQTDQVYLGIALMSQRAVNRQNESEYEQYSSVAIVEKGLVYAFVNGDPVSEDEAFIDNAGGDKGNFSSSGDAVNCVFRSNKYTNTTTSDDIAVVESRGVIKINAEISWS